MFGKEHQVIAWYAAGWSTYEIGEELGIDHSNVLRFLVSRGVTLRTRCAARKQAFQRGRARKKFGARNPAWRGGIKKHSEGYVLHRKPDHPRADCSGYVPEHVLVMERKLGRNLRCSEVVHHVDEDVTNNSPENLILCSCRAEHSRIHAKRVGGMIGKNFRRRKR
jgi:hypothetical protein